MITSTEWAVESPWGITPTKDRETADTMTKNMRDGGHTARVMWRGVTPWMEEGDPDQ